MSVSKWFRRNFSCSGVWGRELLARPDTSGRARSSVVPRQPGRAQGKVEVGGREASTHESRHHPETDAGFACHTPAATCEKTGPLPILGEGTLQPNGCQEQGS